MRCTSQSSRARITRASSSVLPTSRSRLPPFHQFSPGREKSASRVPPPVGSRGRGARSARVRSSLAETSKRTRPRLPGPPGFLPLSRTPDLTALEPEAECQSRAAQRPGRTRGSGPLLTGAEPEAAPATPVCLRHQHDLAGRRPGSSRSRSEWADQAVAAAGRCRLSRVAAVHGKPEPYAAAWSGASFGEGPPTAGSLSWIGSGRAMTPGSRSVERPQ